VLREQRIVRGRILDRDGAVLADVDVADDGVVTRRYLVPEAVPALGYASLRYGTAGIEAALDATLRGDRERTAWESWWEELLHRTPRGADVQLTLDAQLQALAQGRLAEARGAAVLMDVTTGEILVLASSPTFDPERLDEQWQQLTDDPGAPLLNRAAQGLYQPGTVFHTVVLAEALARDLADLGIPYPGLTKPIAVNGVRLRCGPGSSVPETLSDAYKRGCPAPIADLGESLGPDGLLDAVERWDLTIPPALEIPAVASDWTAVGEAPEDVLAETLGQGELVVSPLQVALVVATLGAGGEVPSPHLVLRVQDAYGRWQDSSPPADQKRAITSPIADQLLGAWTTDDQGRILYRLGTAVAGQETNPHVWFTGLTRSPHKRYAVVVLVEHASDEALASELGKELLLAALAP
jgi:peptidoglycan glycosyltransferase